MMTFEKGGALIQHQIFHHSFSSAKAHYPIFFRSTLHLKALFSSICFEKDIFYETESNLASEMGFLDEYLFTSVKESVYRAVADARVQADVAGSKAGFFFALLQTLALHWEEDLEKVFFNTDKSQNCRDVPVPHLVIQDMDYQNICLFVDRTLVFGQLTLSTAIPCLIAAFYMANLCFDEGAQCLTAFLQQELCNLGRLDGKKRGVGKKQKKLSLYQAKKDKIIVRQYRGLTRLTSSN